MRVRIFYHQLQRHLEREIESLETALGSLRNVLANAKGNEWIQAFNPDIEMIESEGYTKMKEQGEVLAAMKKILDWTTSSPEDDDDMMGVINLRDDATFFLEKKIDNTSPYYLVYHFPLDILFKVTGLGPFTEKAEDAAMAAVADYVLKQKNQSAFLLSREPQDRRAIPTKVRQFVWERDGGICARCGSKNNLQYDHIIPVSLGGSNTAENIEILCQACNARKSNRIL
jgi:hypothetical protein